MNILDNMPSSLINKDFLMPKVKVKAFYTKLLEMIFMILLNNHLYNMKNFVR